MKTSRREFLISSAGLAAVPLVGFSPLASAKNRHGTLVVGASNPRHLNPALQSGNATGLPGAQIFAGLLQFDHKFHALPYLAKTWEISSDKLTYTFHLVQDAVFHDGKPITAHDAAFSIETVKAYHPLLSVTYGEILSSASAVDAHTLQIRLKKPFQGLLYTLVSALVPILPKHVYGTGSIQSNPANSKPIGSGPFKFVEWKTGDHIVLEKNEKFFRSGKPYLDRLIFMIMGDPLTRVLALQKGKVDYFPFPFIHFTDVLRLRKYPDLKVTKIGYEALGPTNYININLRHPPLSDLKVRRALAHSIDKNFIVKTLHHGLSRREDGPLYHASPFFNKNVLKIYDYDLKRANQLFDAAGYPRKNGGTRMQLTLDIPTFHPDSTQLVAQYLKSQLRRVGINIILRPSTDLADWASRVGNWNYQLTMDATWNYPDPAIGVSRLYVCSNIKKHIWTNTEGYCNKQVDEWLSAAETEPDFGKRKELYSKFQKQVTEDLPFIWTNEQPYTTIYNAALKSIPNGVWGALDPLDDVQWASSLS